MLAFYTPVCNFSQQQLEDMLILQSKANDVMSDAWRLSCNCTIQYYRAAWKEASEAIDHHGWKWWKKFQPDIDQLKLELIDILHFSLSHELRTHFISYFGDDDAEDNLTEANYVFAEHEVAEVINAAAQSIHNYDNTISIDYVGKYASEDAYQKIKYGPEGEIDIAEFPVVDLMEQFVHATIQHGRPHWETLMALFDAVDMKPTEIYDIYVTKNLLNIFRTSNGQRENTYSKIWSGREDNEFVTDYRKEAEARGETVSVNDLLVYLQTTYDAQIAAGTVAKA